MKIILNVNNCFRNTKYWIWLKWLRNFTLQSALQNCRKIFGKIQFFPDHLIEIFYATPRRLWILKIRLIIGNINL